MTLHEAASTGTRLQALEALRNRLATDIDETDSKRDVASLAQRLMDVLEQIDELRAAKPGQQEVTGLSDFQARLASRSAGAAGARRTTG